jgi:hypothetical protein
MLCIPYGTNAPHEAQLCRADVMNKQLNHDGVCGVKELRDRSSAGAPPLWVLPSPCRISVKKVQKFSRESMDNANFNETTSQHLS